MNWQHILNRTVAFLMTLGDVLMVLMQTIIISFGTLVLMALLLWVEQDAVSHGIATYEPNRATAAGAAAVLVLVNFAVKFWEVYIEANSADLRKRYQPGKEYAFSLRMWWSNIAYFIGFGKRWQKRELPASSGFVHVRKTVTLVMLCIAFVGRTHDAVSRVSIVDGQPIAWHQGLSLIVAQSTLADMTVWFTALIFTFAAVIAAQRLTQYIAVRVHEINRRLSDYRPQKSRTSAKLPAVRPQVVADTTNGHGHGQGYARQTDARDKLRTYLADNPDAVHLSSRQLADIVGVGKSVAAEELTTMRLIRSNGHQERD